MKRFLCLAEGMSGLTAVRLDVRTAVALGAALLLGSAATASNASADEFHPHLASQEVACNIVDKRIAGIPHGDGVAPVTAAETGPGGWRFNTGGGSFVTFHYELNGAKDGYTVDAGRSNDGANTGIVNDYPEFLDLPQAPRDGVLTFGARRGQITLGGGDAFQLPGKDNGRVRISMSDPDRDGQFEGCAKSPQLTNFGFTVKEGGSFVQQELFKAWAQTNPQGAVTSYEWTEISTFNNTDPEGN